MSRSNLAVHFSSKKGTFTNKRDQKAKQLSLFFKKIDISWPCWNWKASKNKDGYGVFANEGAHRFSYRLFVGNIPKNVCVCHTCDNPKCVKPSHLFLTTPEGNNIDRDNKGRTAKGNKISSVKLSIDHVKQIRKLYKTGKYSQRKLANKYRVCQATIFELLHKKNWKYV